MVRIARVIACAIYLLHASQLSAAELRMNMRLSEALDLLRADGIAIVYSSDLIEPGMRLQQIPESKDPTTLLRKLVAPWRLKVQEGPGGTLLVVRPLEESVSPEPLMPAPVRKQNGPEELVISSSRYLFERANGPSKAAFSAADIEQEPGVGDDPMRMISRVPGVTRNDFTAQSYVRGGTQEENLILFDGIRLYNPYHLKGFQSLFSAVDARLIRSMDVYTGGYTTAYGDRMSSVVEIEPIAPEDELYGELTASFFNLSGLVAGNSDDGSTKWLASARRGTLDLLFRTFDPTLGDPSYFDIHTRVSHSFTEAFELSAGALVFDDSIEIADTDQEEFAEGEYRDEYFWVRADFAVLSNLQGQLTATLADLESNRSGSVEKEGAAQGSLIEDNDFTISSLQTDWSWQLSDTQSLQFGGEFRHQKGLYSYRDQAQFELLFDTPNAPMDAVRASYRQQEYSGNYFAVYSSLRSKLTDKLTTELGLRWNQETLSPANSTSLDPRFSALYSFTDATRGRISVGRYSQAQSINELNFADGEELFSPFEKADQLIASIEHGLNDHLYIRSEVYLKRYSDLQPRFENFLDNYTLLPTLWPDRVEIAATDATAKGIELTVGGSKENALNWWLSYGWSSVKDDYGSYSLRRSWDQQHTLGAGLNWRKKQWEFSIAGNWHSGWPTTTTGLQTEEPVPVIGAATRNTSRLEEYRSIDARVARDFSLENEQRLTVFLEIHNLTNRNNKCCVQYEIAEETGDVTYLTDTEGQVPAFPSVGFIWQF